jgi:hypothetical protein
MLDIFSWRLGLDGRRQISRLTQLLGLIENYTKAVSNSSTEVKRGRLSNIFVLLETELSLALRFSEWALTSDHYITEQRFRFAPERLSQTSDLFEAHGSTKAAPTLNGTAGSFKRLARALDGTTPIRREPDAFPDITKISGRPFAFPFTRLFDNLNSASKATITSVLGEVSKTFSHSDLLLVRNTGPGHGNHAFPSDDLINSVLLETERALLQIQRHGLSPTVFIKESAQNLEGGKKISRYTSGADETSHSVVTPCWPVAPGLPGEVPHLIIIPSAIGMGWGATRFSLSPTDRGGKYWWGWPPKRNRNSDESTWEDHAAIPMETVDELTTNTS